MSELKASVIISAYNNLDALIRALPFWEAQTEAAFELVIADDGSKAENIDMFKQAANQTSLNIRHVWHEDNGFDKCGILNKAILISRSDRLLFLDADMLPRFDLVAHHTQLLKKNRFISGGSHINLSAEGQETLNSLAPEQVREIFTSNALVDAGYVSQAKRNRITSYGLKARALDILTYRSNAFSGANASCWKADALRVNGFDEQWGYGGLDRDFGIRLTNIGLSSRRHQYSLVALHQDHQRPYSDRKKVQENKRRLKERIKQKVAYVEKGIDKHSADNVQILWSQGH